MYVFLFSLFVIRVAQTKQNKEKVADYLHEVDKTLARYRDYKDLEMMLKEKEREDDPMLAYMKQKKEKQDIKAGKKGGNLIHRKNFGLLLHNSNFSCSRELFSLTPISWKLEEGGGE